MPPNDRVFYHHQSGSFFFDRHSTLARIPTASVTRKQNDQIQTNKQTIHPIIMCGGTATKLLCSHWLVHWSGPRCPKRCVLPDRRAVLHCTCAGCDPAFNQSRLVRSYADARDSLCAQARTALQEGRLRDAKRLEREIRVLQGAQVAKLGRTRVSGLDPVVGCRWPGEYDQWVDENYGRPVDWDFLLTG